MAKSITFIAGIAREGSNGSVRGKIPAGLIKAIGAKEGQAVEFKVMGTTLVGAKVLDAKEFKALKREKAAEAPAPKKSASTRKVGKTTLKASASPAVKRVGKKPLPVKKSNKNRATEVEYEAPKVSKKSKIKLKLKRKK